MSGTWQEIPVRSLADARTVEKMLGSGFTVCSVCKGHGYRLRLGDVLFGWLCKQCGGGGLIRKRDQLTEVLKENML